MTSRFLQRSPGFAGLLCMLLGAFFWFLAGLTWFSLHPWPGEAAELIGLFAAFGTVAIAGGLIVWRGGLEGWDVTGDTAPFPYRAARASCWVPWALAMAFSMMWSGMASREPHLAENTSWILAATIFVVCGLGLAFGIWALLSTRKLGAKGLLWSASFGVLLNAGILVWLLVTLARGISSFPLP